MFLRTKFICIIWTDQKEIYNSLCSWGLSLFVLFERTGCWKGEWTSSWGLSLFVLFELSKPNSANDSSSWGLSLFVLFEHDKGL